MEHTHTYCTLIHTHLKPVNAVCTLALDAPFIHLNVHEMYIIWSALSKITFVDLDEDRVLPPEITVLYAIFFYCMYLITQQTDSFNSSTVVMFVRESNCTWTEL